MRMGQARATRFASSVGQVLALVLGFIGLFTNPMLVFIALVIYLAGQREASRAQMKDVAAGLRASDATMTELVALPSSATLDDAAQLLLRTSQHEFPVLDAARRPLGVLTRDALISALQRRGPEAPVQDSMYRDLAVVSAGDPLDAVIERMQQSGAPGVAVADAEGGFWGLITPESVGELMLVGSVRQRPAFAVWQHSHAPR
jgi:stage IV sporulation protein FB